MTSDTTTTAAVGEIRCTRCQTLLHEGQDRETTAEGTFCRTCFEQLRQQIQVAVAAQGSDVNYPLALAGGLAGAVVGVLAWWGFTALTGIAFGLVAVVIGLAVGKGVVLGSGGKRSPGLQALSIAIAVAGFIYATFLVHRTFILRYLAESQQPGTLPLAPTPDQFFQVVQTGFGLMDFVFLAIVVYEAWKIPAPFKLRS